LKIGHITNWTPHGCGLYETVRDLVIAERSLGVDARVVEVKPIPVLPSMSRPIGDPCERCGHVRLERLEFPKATPDWSEDRGVVKAPMTWLDEVDIICSHSGLPPKIPHGNDTPRIHVAHGRPHSSFLLGQMQNNHVWQAYQQYAKDDRWKALITLWPGFSEYWKLVFPRRVEEFSPFVDLERWKPTQSKYNFGDKGGEPNVVVADVWRQDKDPFHCLFGFAKFAETNPKAKLHIYGLQPNDVTALSPILDALSAKGMIGEVQGRIDNLVEIYNAADLLMTPHVIATRTIREASACGLTVVAGGNQPYSSYYANPEQPDEYAAAIGRAWTDVKNHREARRSDVRTMAERLFDPAKTAGQFIELFEELAK